MPDVSTTAGLVAVVEEHRQTTGAGLLAVGTVVVGRGRLPRDGRQAASGRWFSTENCRPLTKPLHSR